MTTGKLKELEQRIASLRQEIASMGDMRPGTLTIQFRNPSEKQTPFNQLSYTHRSKSRSEYVRERNLEIIRREIATYRRFRKRLEKLIDLSIQASKMRIAASEKVAQAKQGREDPVRRRE